uniref:Uncharacterized protein n=1 Tax=Eutreptiella gymnastica TaxID=73025 RepID=A0A7S1I5Q7_9EUGL|mmetsp:Transcript_132165/g.229146  ORF Transcript_132165/g.229146 Transcript_132165/m.229146 type:complete len:510 (+) Transcript_132165:93-1622(+)
MVKCVPKLYKGTTQPVDGRNVVVGDTIIVARKDRPQPLEYHVGCVSKCTKKNLSLENCIAYTIGRGAQSGCITGELEPKLVHFHKTQLHPMMWQLIPPGSTTQPLLVDSSVEDDGLAAQPCNGAQYHGQLPPELWERIGDFLGAGALDRACVDTWALLRGRHLRWRVPDPEATEALAVLAGMIDELRTFSLTVPSHELRTVGVEGLPILIQAPLLQTLTLNLEDNCLSPADARAIATLKGCPALTSLHLELGGNNLGAAAAKELAELRLAPALRTLHLRLGGNSLAAGGSRALVGLREAPALRTLVLDLASNNLGVGGLQFIAGLSDSTSLQTLDLDLSTNDLQPGDAQALQRLNRMSQLQHLHLNLAANWIGPTDAKALALMRLLPHLRSLSLSLGDNNLGPQGVKALVSLKDCPCLHQLTLDLEGNSVGKGGSQPLTALAECRSLRHLYLDVSYNELSAIDAPTFLAFANLETLLVSAEGNDMGSKGIEVRNTLKKSRISNFSFQLD